MAKDERIVLTDPNQIPELLTREERVAFWKKAELTAEFFSKLEDTPEEELPPAREPRGCE